MKLLYKSESTIVSLIVSVIVHRVFLKEGECEKISRYARSDFRQFV